MTSRGAPGPSGPPPAIPARAAIGEYRILRACTGGEQEDPSFLVWDPASRQQAVLQTYASTPPEGRSILLARLQNDADVSAGLTHPGVVRVLGVGVDGEIGPFLVREYVSGPSLRALPHMEVDLQAALSILIQAAHALVAADAAAVAPRNLRLEHVYVTRSGQVKITVFGRPHITPPAPATSAYDLARVGLELITGQEPFPDADAAGAPRIPVALDKGLASAFSRALSTDAETRFAGLIPFVQVLVAEAPLSEEIRAELLELTDRREPIVEDARVAGWARDIWKEGEVPASTPLPAVPAGIPLAAVPSPPPPLRLVKEPPAEVTPPAPASAPPVTPPSAPEPAARAAPPPAAVRPPASPPKVAPARRSGAALWIALGVGLTAAAAGAWFALGSRPQLVEVISTPPGAQVTFGGRVLGATPLQVEVPPAGGSVALSLPGYLAAEAPFLKGEAQLRVVLMPVPVPPPPEPPSPAPVTESAPPPPPAEAAHPADVAPSASPEAKPDPQGKATANGKAAADGKATKPPKAKPKPPQKPKKTPEKGPTKKGFDLFRHLEKESERG